MAVLVLIFVAIVFITWLIAVISLLNVIANSNIGWKQFMFNGLIVFDAKRLELNEIGETHHKRFIRAFIVFFVLLLIAVLPIFFIALKSP